MKQKKWGLDNRKPTLSVKYSEEDKATLTIINSRIEKHY